MTAPAGRFLFPEDRATFVYGRPGDPIRTPPRTAIKIFTDEAGTQPADILTPEGNPIPYSTLYTAEDSLLPEFFGPEGYMVRVWARVVGGHATTYPLIAQYSAQLANIPMLTNGIGPPPDELGVVGSFYIDLNPADPGDPDGPGNPDDGPQLYGPRTPDGWPATGTPLRGPQGPSGRGATWVQVEPSLEWRIPHNMTRSPSVTCIDSAGMQFFADVIYPPGEPQVVLVRCGAPESGRAELK